MFKLSQKRRINLIYAGNRFIKDKSFKNSTNWRCGFISNGRFQCKARAITKVFNNIEMIRLSNNHHSHPTPCDD